MIENKNKLDLNTSLFHCLINGKKIAETPDLEMVCSSNSLRCLEFIGLCDISHL